MFVRFWRLYLLLHFVVAKTFHEQCQRLVITGLDVQPLDFTLISAAESHNGKSVWVGATGAHGIRFLFWTPDAGAHESGLWVVSGRLEQEGQTELSSIVYYVTGHNSESKPSSSQSEADVVWRLYNTASATFDVALSVEISCAPCGVISLAARHLGSSLRSCAGPYLVKELNLDGSRSVRWNHVSEQCSLSYGQMGGKWELTSNDYSRMSIDHANLIHCTASGGAGETFFEVDGDTLISSQSGAVLSVSHGLVWVSLRLEEGVFRGENMRAATVQIIFDGIPFSAPLRGGLGDSLSWWGIPVFTTVAGSFVIDMCIKVGSEANECMLSGTAWLNMYDSGNTIIMPRDLARHAAMRELERGSRARQRTRVLHVVPLQSLDGYTINALNQARLLPRATDGQVTVNFLDLSCTPPSSQAGIGPLAAADNITTIHLCVSVPTGVVPQSASEVEGGGYEWLFLHLQAAGAWTDVDPSLADALLPLRAVLAQYDVLVVSSPNAVSMPAPYPTTFGRLRTAYVIEAARLCGVRGRIVDVGSNGMPLPYPADTAAITSYLAPSHAIAVAVQGSREVAQNVQVKVCRPILYDKHERMQPSTPSSPAAPASQREVKFVFVGRLEAIKSPSTFILAFAQLKKLLAKDQRCVIHEALGTGVDVTRDAQFHGHTESSCETSTSLEDNIDLRAILVGGGAQLSALEALVKENDIANLVEFMGPVSPGAVSSIVSGAAALVMPSLCAETFGMVLAEAMLLGVPAVIFGFGGQAELVRHMRNGLIVETPTAAALAEALMPLALDPLLVSRLGRQAQKDAAVAMDRPLITECYARVYEKYGTNERPND